MEFGESLLILSLLTVYMCSPFCGYSCVLAHIVMCVHGLGLSAHAV